MSHCLEGMIIKKILIAKDKKALLFKTESEDIKALTYGDCCSNSWIEHIELPAFGFPAKVMKAKDIGFVRDAKKKEFEVEKYYGFKIETDKGDIVIDYRNESNGYYGGDLVWPPFEHFYEGVYGQNISDEDWQEVNKDI